MILSRLYTQCTVNLPFYISGDPGGVAATVRARVREPGPYGLPDAV